MFGDLIYVVVGFVLVVLFGWWGVGLGLAFLLGQVCVGAQAEWRRQKRLRRWR